MASQRIRQLEEKNKEARRLQNLAKKEGKKAQKAYKAGTCPRGLYGFDRTFVFGRPNLRRRRITTRRRRGPTASCFKRKRPPGRLDEPKSKENIYIASWKPQTMSTGACSNHACVVGCGSLCNLYHGLTVRQQLMWNALHYLKRASAQGQGKNRKGRILDL